MHVTGKHPVSVLMELCAQKKLNPPDFEMALDGGPSHRKVFKYKVYYLSAISTLQFIQ